jgi:hypothetical protein
MQHTPLLLLLLLLLGGRCQQWLLLLQRLLLLPFGMAYGSRGLQGGPHLQHCREHCWLVVSAGCLTAAVNTCECYITTLRQHARSSSCFQPRMFGF